MPRINESRPVVLRTRVDVFKMMPIELPLEIVDSSFDIVLSKEGDLSFTRRKYASPERIIYSITLHDSRKTKFKIRLYKIREGLTEITFPVRVPDWKAVFRPPLKGIGLIAGTNDYVPTSFADKTQEKTYRVCNAIWLHLKLNERYVRASASRSGDGNQESRPPKPQQPPKPKQGSNLDVWFDYYHAMNDAGFKMTFEMLAAESNYSRNTFKQAHRKYKISRGIDLPND